MDKVKTALVQSLDDLKQPAPDYMVNRMAPSRYYSDDEMINFLWFKSKEERAAKKAQKAQLKEAKTQSKINKNIAKGKSGGFWSNIGVAAREYAGAIAQNNPQAGGNISLLGANTRQQQQQATQQRNMMLMIGAAAIGAILLMKKK